MVKCCGRDTRLDPLWMCFCPHDFCITFGSTKYVRVLEALSTDTVAFLFAWFLVLAWNSMLEEKIKAGAFWQCISFSSPPSYFQRRQKVELEMVEGYTPCFFKTFDLNVEPSV